MKQITVSEALWALFVNKTAAYYAVVAAAIVAPLYVLIFQHLLRAVAAAATQCWRARAHSSSPHRPSTGTAAGRNSDLFATPQSYATPARGGRRSGTAADEQERDDGDVEGDLATPSSPSTRLDTDADFAVYGQPAKMTMGHPPPLRPAAAHHHHRTPPRGGSTDAALEAAIASGEVFYHPTNPVMSIEQKVRRMFSRYRRSRLYAETNMTAPALAALYERPAFQAWYADHRQELIEEAQVRHNGLRLRGLSSFLTLLIGVFALPAFSFSNAAWVSSPLCCFRPLPAGAPVAQATFGQLLARRATYLREVRALPAVLTAPGSVAARLLPAIAAEGLRQVWNTAELVALVAAVCALLTSAFMPRGRKITAVTAMWALAIAMAESVMGGEEGSVAVQLGMGVGVVIGTVAVSVATACK